MCFRCGCIAKKAIDVAGKSTRGRGKQSQSIVQDWTIGREVLLVRQSVTRMRDIALFLRSIALTCRSRPCGWTLPSESNGPDRGSQAPASHDVWMCSLKARPISRVVEQYWWSCIGTACLTRVKYRKRKSRCRGVAWTSKQSKLLSGLGRHENRAVIVESCVLGCTNANCVGVLPPG